MGIMRRVLPYAATVLLTAAVIYLTPLKWLPVIEPTIKDIDPSAFQAEFLKNSDHYLFIDVRPEASYNKVHAVGSINMPLNTLYDERHVLPKTGKMIVLICSDARASGVAYSYLQHYGFYNIERIKGGVTEWIAQGLPVEGTAPSESSVSLGTGLTMHCA
jgi:rhodanese-related sulfurtransferase